MATFWTVFDSVAGRVSGLAQAIIDATGLTAARTYALPDASGTLATEGAVLLQNGFVSFGGSGDYYSITFPAITLLRPATGRIGGKEITCPANSSVNFTTYATTYIGVNASGELVATTTVDSAWYASNFALFEIIADSQQALVVFENHPAGTLQGDASDYAHHVFGALIGKYPGESAIGGDIARVTTGTGAVATDRMLKVVGNAMLYDHGVNSPVLDSAGAGIYSFFAYQDSQGRWIAYNFLQEFPIVWANTGTVTALSSGRFSIMSVYVTKVEPNSGATVYITIVGTADYPNISQAQTALANGEVPIASGALAKLETALLGHIIITGNASGGYIAQVQISKQIAGTGGGGGGVGGTAALTTTSTTAFNGVLTSAETTVQLALDKLDDHTHAALYQPLDATLTAVAGLTTSADKVPYFTGTDTATTATLTTFGRSLIDDADAAAGRATLVAAGTGVANTFSDVQTITANSASPALKVTQAGSGDALLVEDVASDTTPFVVDASGRVGIGTDSPIISLDVRKGTQTFPLFGVADTTSYAAFFCTDSNGPTILWKNSQAFRFGATPGDTLYQVASYVEFCRITGTGQFSLGTTTPSASAILDVQSTTQGFLPPRMTTTQRDAISTPAAGLVIYNSTTNKLQCYNGTTWNDLF